MDVKRKASEGIVAIPAKKAKNELALRYGARSDFDENVSSHQGGARTVMRLVLVSVPVDG